jgi:hypothetical protein
VFTPNGDGKNDTYLVKVSGEELFELSIWNRWGGKVFDTTDAKKGWTGKVNNTGEDLNKPFGADLNSGSVYSSFLVTVTATTPSVFFFHLGYYSNTTTPVLTSLNTAFRARTFITPGTDPATQFKLGLAFNATTTQGETSNLNKFLN